MLEFNGVPVKVAAAVKTQLTTLLGVGQVISVAVGRCASHTMERLIVDPAISSGTNGLNLSQKMNIHHRDVLPEMGVTFGLYERLMPSIAECFISTLKLLTAGRFINFDKRETLVGVCR